MKRTKSHPMTFGEFDKYSRLVKLFPSLDDALNLYLDTETYKVMSFWEFVDRYLWLGLYCFCRDNKLSYFDDKGEFKGYEIL